MLKELFPSDWDFCRAYLDEVLDEAIVKIFSAQMCVSSCGLDLEDAFINGQQGDIEGTTTQIKDEDVLLAHCPLLVQACNGEGRMRYIAEARKKVFQ